MMRMYQPLVTKNDVKMDVIVVETFMTNIQYFRGFYGLNLKLSKRHDKMRTYGYTKLCPTTSLDIELESNKWDVSTASLRKTR